MEIFLSGVWGTVSHDGAYPNDAEVVCRQLGYNTYGTVYTVISRVIYEMSDTMCIRTLGLREKITYHRYLL